MTRRADGLAIFTRSLAQGGAERQLTNLAKEAHSQGRSVRVIAMYGGGPLEAELIAAGVEVTSLGKGGRWNLVGPISALYRDLRRAPPEALYCFLIVPCVVGYLCGCVAGVRRIGWGLRGTSLGDRPEDWMVQLLFAISRRLVGSVDFLIANAEQGKQFYAEMGYPIEKISVIPNGIDTEHFKFDAAGRRAKRTELVIAESVPLVGVLARVTRPKDPSTFVSAVRHVHRRRPEVRFVWVGDGAVEDVQALDRMIAEAQLGGVLQRIPGTAQPEAWYSAFDLFCLPSCSEGFPNVLAEAMSVGVPVVSTDAGDAARIIGDRRWVSPVGDGPALGELILARLAEQATVPCEALRGRIIDTFSVGTMVRQTLVVALPDASARAHQ